MAFQTPAFDIQPSLETEQVRLEPLLPSDFEALYAVASDPAIWEQHPNKDRWKEEVFSVFFEGAIQSRGAFKIIDRSSGQIIGSTRIYDFDPAENYIHIGYTFLARQYWGKGVNPTVKRLLLEYLLPKVQAVRFHIGAQNLRSQIAITRIGAQKIGEIEIAYFGEPVKWNFVYEIRRENLPYNIS